MCKLLEESTKKYNFYDIKTKSKHWYFKKNPILNFDCNLNLVIGVGVQEISKKKVKK